MFPLTAFLTCDLLASQAENQRLFYKKCYKELSNEPDFMYRELCEVLDAAVKVTKSISEQQLTLTKILLGKGYDKLQQWRRGEISRINPEDVDIFNWNTYLREDAQRHLSAFNEDHPTYFEDLRREKEERRKHMSKEELAQDMMLELMML